MIPPLGRAYWALAPFSPEPPYELLASNGETVGVDAVSSMTRAAAPGSNEFRIVLAAKVRPVLVISEVLEPFGEVLALRLQRLERLNDEDRERVRAGGDKVLQYLDTAHFPGLPVENAAIVTSSIRLPHQSLDTSVELGRMDDDGLRDLHERFAAAHGLRLDRLVNERAVALLAVDQD